MTKTRGPGADVTAMSDQTLMRTVASGDHRAFAEVYERHAGPAQHVARGLCGSQGDDVVQEVFLRLWRHPEAFDSARGTLRTYVIMAVRNRAIDVLRSTRSRRNREDRFEAAQERLGPAGAPFEADQFDATQILAVLSPAQRDAIVLAFFGDCTYQEAAILLDRPEGTVKGHIRSGLKRMRTELDHAADLV